MSMNIYAATLQPHETLGEVWRPVVPFECWETHIADPAAKADDKDARILNPKHVENARLYLSDANTRLLFEQIGLGFETPTLEIPIATIHRAGMLGLNGAAAQYTQPDQVAVGAEGTTVQYYGVVEGYMAYRLGQLLSLVVEGRKRGATHIIAA